MKLLSIFLQMVDFLEKEGLSTEGILRVSGADARAKVCSVCIVCMCYVLFYLYLTVSFFCARTFIYSL